MADDIGLTPRKAMAQGKEPDAGDFDVKPMSAMDTSGKPGPGAAALDAGGRAVKPYNGLSALRPVDTGSFK